MTLNLKTIRIPDLLATFITILFIIFWFYISIFKFLSFNDYYGDLGQNTSYLIAIYNTRSPTALFEEVRPQSYFSFIIALIMGIFPSAFTLIALQILTSGLSILFLYFYAFRSTENKWYSLIISLTYALSFSLNATLWQAYGHIMQFFPFFFFLALVFERKRKYLFYSLIIMASLTNIVMLFSMMLLLFVKGINQIKYKGTEKHGFIRKFGIDKILSILILCIPVILFFLQEKTSEFLSFNNGNFAYSGSLTITQIASLYVNNFINTIDSKILVLSLILLPFIFLFVKKNRDFLVILPVAIFILFSNYAIGYFNFQFYISSTLLPVLFFILIDNFKLYFPGKHYAVVTYSSLQNFKKCIAKNNIANTVFKEVIKNKVVFYLLVSTVLVSLFYAPWGMLNSHNIPGQNLNSYYNFEQDTHITSSELGADQFLSLIPMNATVLIQNNMPIFSNRDRNYLFGPNFIPSNMTNFPPGPVPRTFIPEFIVVDESSYWFVAPFEAGHNMAYWMYFYTTEYHYGVRAVAGYFKLYELNYNGNVTKFE